MKKIYTILAIVFLAAIGSSCSSGQGRYLPITGADGFQGTFDTQTGEYYYVNDPVNSKEVIYRNPVKEVKEEQEAPE